MANPPTATAAISLSFHRPVMLRFAFSTPAPPRNRRRQAAEDYETTLKFTSLVMLAPDVLSVTLMFSR